ncbi:hypothetical protein C8J57DRAFT_1346612 [Mycena rebaudengoi]|nr:hypothetical protein C8J57DRAFT_1346612 [Mycena rebaudengoi]
MRALMMLAWWRVFVSDCTELCHGMSWWDSFDGTSVSSALRICSFASCQTYRLPALRIFQLTTDLFAKIQPLAQSALDGPVASLLSSTILFAVPRFLFCRHFVYLLISQRRTAARCGFGVETGLQFALIEFLARQGLPLRVGGVLVPRRVMVTSAFCVGFASDSLTACALRVCSFTPSSLPPRRTFATKIKKLMQMCLVFISTSGLGVINHSSSHSLTLSYMH